MIDNTGIYELTESVKNPEPDKRYAREMGKQGVWSKGTRYVVRPGGEGYVARAKPINEVPSDMNEHHPGWQAFVDKLILVEDVDAIVAAAHEFHSVSSREIVSQLVKLGRVTLSDVQDAVLAQVAEDDKVMP